MDILFSEWISLCEALSFQKRIDILVEQFVTSFLEGLAPEEQALLVQKARAGDWHPLMSHYQPQFMMWLRNNGVQDADAQDIAQTAMVQLFKKLPTLQDPSKLEGWLRMIAQNALKNSFRKRRDKPESSFRKSGSEDEFGIEDLGNSGKGGKFTQPEMNPTMGHRDRSFERSPVYNAIRNEEEPITRATMQPFIDELQNKNPTAYKIVSMFANDGKTFEQIAEELGMEVAQVARIFDSAMNMIKTSSGADVSASDLQTGREAIHTSKIHDIPGMEDAIDQMAQEYPKHAQALRMKRNGAGYPEIAAHFGINTNQAKSMLNTANIRVGKLLGVDADTLKRFAGGAKKT